VSTAGQKKGIFGRVRQNRGSSGGRKKFVFEINGAVPHRQIGAMNL
jgi:hypothetical protein